MRMRKRSVMLVSVGLVVLVGLIGTVVVLAQGGEDWQQPVEVEAQSTGEADWRGVLYI